MTPEIDRPVVPPSSRVLIVVVPFRTSLPAIVLETIVAPVVLVASAVSVPLMPRALLPVIMVPPRRSRLLMVCCAVEPPILNVPPLFHSDRFGGGEVVGSGRRRDGRSVAEVADDQRARQGVHATGLGKHQGAFVDDCRFGVGIGGTTRERDSTRTDLRDHEAAARSAGQQRGANGQFIPERGAGTLEYVDDSVIGEAGGDRAGAAQVGRYRPTSRGSRRREGHDGVFDIAARKP